MLSSSATHLYQHCLSLSVCLLKSIQTKITKAETARKFKCLLNLPINVRKRWMYWNLLYILYLYPNEIADIRVGYLMDWANC